MGWLKLFVLGLSLFFLMIINGALQTGTSMELFCGLVTFSA